MSELMNPDVLKPHRPATATSRVMTVVLEGELDRSEAEEVVGMLGRLCEQGVHDMVLDLSDVTHFDYRAVRPLVRRAEVMRELGGDLKLAGLSPYLHAIFRSAGAHDAFDYFAEAEHAVRSFDRGVLLYG